MKDGSLTSSGKLDASRIGSKVSFLLGGGHRRTSTGLHTHPPLELWGCGDRWVSALPVSAFGWQEGYHNTITGSVLRPQARRGGRRGVQCVCFLNAVGLNSSSL